MSHSSISIHLRDETVCRARVFSDFVAVEFTNTDKYVGDVNVFYSSLEQVKKHLAALQVVVESFPE